MGEHEWAKHQRDGWTYCLRCGMVRNHQGKETACRVELPKVEPRTEKKTFLSTETCGTCEEREAELRRLRAACESMAEQLERAEAKLRDLSHARPREEYHEDDGIVLWWMLPVVEPPYVGRDDDDEFPGYQTHWTPLPKAPGEP